MTTLVGTLRLVRFVLRTERLRLSIWIVVLALLVVGTANAFMELYPSLHVREQLVSTVGSSPALTAMLGPVAGSSIGALTAWRVGTLGALLVGIMAVLTVIRHTREEEETGRRELLGSTVLGRHAPLAAALVVSAGAGLVLGLLIAGGLVRIGLETRGALAFGIGFTVTAFVFTMVAGVAAQLTAGAGAARGIAMTAVGAAFLLRVAGDGGGLPLLSWLSPIGWFTKLGPFAESGERWWVLALSIGLGLMLGAAAFLQSSRRDVGAGAVPPRPGPADAPSLSSPFGLALRLQRGGLIGWTLGLAVVGLVYGSVGDSVGDLLADNPQLAEFFEMLGGEQGITDAFFATSMGILAVIASAYAIRAALRLRVEEQSQRAESLLATATPRWRWARSHLYFALLGSVLMLAVAGLVAGATYAVIASDPGQAPRILGTALIQVPAVWVVAGVATALFGLAPRLTALSWGVLVACLVFGQLGEILQFPQWLLNLSPFTHVPDLPAANLEIMPLVWLVALAAVLVASGVAGLQRRDFG